MNDATFLFLRGLSYPFFWYFSVINLVYTLLLIIGIFHIFKRKKEISNEDFTQILQSEFLPEISFIVPVYNESVKITVSLDSLLNLSYRYKEIIVVNDGSTDDTVSICKKHLDLVQIPKYYEDKLPSEEILAVYRSKKHPELLFIDKKHAKKYDALNAGINACQNTYFVCVDSDTFIEDAAFEPLIRPLLTDPEIIAMAASVRLKNGCNLEFNRISTLKFPLKPIPGLQSLEYLRAFEERQGWSAINSLFVLSGCFAIFQTQIVIEAGGYVDTIAEDMEIIVRLHRIMKKKGEPYKIIYSPDPVAWTEGPETLKRLRKQRANWHKGLCDCLWFHKTLFFNPKQGFFGLFIYPFWVFCEALEPVVEIVGMVYVLLAYYFGLVHVIFIYFFILLTFGFNFVFTLTCILIEELTFKKFSSLKTLLYHLLYNCIENFGYRQLTAIWRLEGILLFFKDMNHVKKISAQVSSFIKHIKTQTQQKAAK